MENDIKQAVEQQDTEDKNEDTTNEITITDESQKEQDNNENTTETIPENIQEKSWPITILFPPMYEKETIERLFAIIEEQSGVKAKAKQPTTQQQYTILVERFIQSQSSTIDIIIAPSDHRESYTTRWMSFSLPEWLQRFYHEWFFDHMYTDSPTIVPVWIDPLVLFTKDQQTPIETTRDLLAADVRFWLWFNQKDLKDLDKKTPPFTDANTVIKVLIEESLDRTIIEWILLFVNNNQWEWNTESATVTAWFLSNTQQYEWYTQAQLLPWSSLRTYPARGRWMIINDNSERKTLIEDWIGWYITVSVETNTVPYPDGLLWATHSVMQRQFLQAFTAPLQKIRNTKQFISGTVETADDIIYTDTFKKAISWEIDQKTFLQTISITQ